MMHKRALWIGILLLIAVVSGCQRSSQMLPKQILFFYGTGCPHCKATAQFMAAYKVRSKLSFQEKEVYHNRANMEQLVYLAKHCNSSIQTVDLPFVWTGRDCIMGGPQVIAYFKEQINAQR